MSFYRTLLWWLVLAALGALAWELLSQDLGNVVIRWHGQTITTTVAFALVAWAFLSLLFWALWSLARLPFVAWRRHAKRQARQRLINGLIALHEGRHARAESLLAKAAAEDDARLLARIGAREAALRRGDLVAAATLQAALTESDPLAAALHAADSLLAQQRAQDVLELLQPFVEQRSLPPRGVLQRGEALCLLGRADEALSLIESLRAEQSLSIDNLLLLERRWRATMLRQSPDANELHRRWMALPALARDEHALIVAYAERAGALGLEAQAADALADALDQRWDETLVRTFGLLPPAREDRRLARAERWLAQHPADAALSLALGRICLRQQQWSRAEDMLNRAIVQGAGSEAWEELGHLHTAGNDSARAQLSYANALRAQRGEATLNPGGRTLREQIAAEAVLEQRNEHGLPLLPREPL